MTNTIKAKHLTPGVRFIDPEGNIQTTVRVRMIDHRRVRIDTKEGAAQADRDDIFLLDE